MLEVLLSKEEELSFYFRQLGKLSMYNIKQWNNKPNSLIMNFSYTTKRRGNHLFTITFVLTESELRIHQNLNIGGGKTPFELRVVFSKAIDLFIEELMSIYTPDVYIKTVLMPVRYPPSYLDKKSRVKKRKNNNRKDDLSV